MLLLLESGVKQVTWEPTKQFDMKLMGQRRTVFINTRVSWMLSLRDAFTTFIHLSVTWLFFLWLKCLAWLNDWEIEPTMIVRQN